MLADPTVEIAGLALFLLVSPHLVALVNLTERVDDVRIAGTQTLHLDWRVAAGLALDLRLVWYSVAEIFVKLLINFFVGVTVGVDLQCISVGVETEQTHVLGQTPAEGFTSFFVDTVPADIQVEQKRITFQGFGKRCHIVAD